MLTTILQWWNGRCRSSRASRTRVLRMEGLEKKRLCAINVTDDGHVTTVTGDNNPNTIEIVTITIDHATMYRFTAGDGRHWDFDRHDIRVNMLGGNDYVKAGNVTNPMVVHGGAGNDVIQLGKGNDRAFGDAGNDVIRGNAGNDVLYGGDGNDQLFGGAGNDWLYGQAGADLLNTVDGNAKLSGDRIVNPQLGTDTIQRDPAEAVAASATIVDPHTNYVRFNGQVVDLNVTETNGIYDATIDGDGYGLFRDDVGPTVVNAYNLTVDAVISDGDFTWNMLG